MALSQDKKYIGDAAVAHYLEHYNSQTPFHVVRLRVIGALASPNAELLPVMVFASFWPEEGFPQFETKAETEKFFEVFMGLWARMEKVAASHKNLLSAPGKVKNKADLKALLFRRMEELEAGFIEGFWGGRDDLPMSSAAAALIDGLGSEVETLNMIYQDVADLPDSQNKVVQTIFNELIERDVILEDTINSLLILKSKSQKQT